MAEGAKKCSTAVLQDDLHYDRYFRRAK